MAGVHENGICNNTYDERDRKAKMLLCGDTYCQPCLQGVVLKGSPAFPSCRRDIVSPVDELPVNFIAIPASGSDGAASKNGAGRDLLCSSHKKEVDLWCRECKVLLCKLCLMTTHNGHKSAVIEEAFADKEILADRRNKIIEDLQKTKLSLESLRQMKSLASKIDKLKTSEVEMVLSKKHSNLIEKLNKLKKVQQESPSMEKHAALECLKNDTQTLIPIDVSAVMRQVDGWISFCRANNYMPKDYMPHDQTWEITAGEAADRALRTMKETDHTTPKAIVRSTDESPILCLFELLQYLAVASGTMALELMDTVERKWPHEKEWFPLKTGGRKSTDRWHCRRLRALARAWRGLPAAAPASGVGPGKVVAIVDCETRARDVGVLAVGKNAKRADGSWPLSLEVHLVDYFSCNLQWLKLYLPSLYASAEPSLCVCRVYLPGGDEWYTFRDLFPLLAELGRKYSTEHFVYLDRSLHRDYDHLSRRRSAEHKLAYEWRDF